MKKFLLTLTLLGTILLTGCVREAKNWGGDETIELEPNQKLELITWKEESLWILTRPMREDESAETWTYKENSKYGLMEGTITIIESRE